MRLSECLSERNAIVRDGDFLSLGTLFSHNPQQVVYAVSEQDIRKIAGNPSVSCVITTAALSQEVPCTIGIAAVRDPRREFQALQSLMARLPEFILPTFINRISPSAKIHPSALIAPHSVVIGRDVVIEKNVVVNGQTIIDEGSIIRSNCIIGDAVAPFGNTQEGALIQPPGGVHLHRDVDLHANIIIRRAAFKGYTEIGEQTKIDNLSTIGQGTVIGKHCLLCGGVTLGDFITIGDDGWIGPNVYLSDQIAIGNRVYITIGSRVSRDIADAKVVKDNFVLDRNRFKGVIRGM